MDFCLLEDVFPDWTKKQTTDGDMAPAGCGVPPVTKKKSKKGKGKDPALRFLDPSYTLDPDRPFLVKAEVKEPFGGNAPGTRPAYFGASGEDEGFTSVIGTDPSYSAPLTGVAAEVEIMKKSAGEVSLLPDLSLDDMWKPLTEAGVTTANVHSLPTPTTKGQVHLGYPPSTPQPSYSMPDDLKKRMEQIYSRLEQLEVKTHESSKTEILIFVGSGLFFLVSLNLLAGRS